MTMTTTSYTVGQVAAIAGVSVRTLHHYDRIGLLSPGERGLNGYRRYAAADLERLHRVLSYRELGLTLDAIAQLLDDAADPAVHLERQERLLRDRIARLEDLLAAVQTTKEAMTMGIDLTPEEKFELFGDLDPERHEDEVRERWGGTPEHAESRRRTARYTKEDWRRLLAESDRITDGLVALLKAGVAPDDHRAMALAQEQRDHITRWFYECTAEVHAGLAAQYVGDARFRRHYEDRAAGLAQYLHDAIVANATAR